MKIDDLRILEENPFKSKGDKQIRAIAKSIKDFEKMMSLRPIIIDDENIVLGGNKRVQALKVLGYTEIPDDWIKQSKDLSDKEKKEFIIKDNAHWGSDWDFDMLNDWNVDLADFGHNKKNKSFFHFNWFKHKCKCKIERAKQRKRFRSLFHK
jgi:hypothetical protein